MDQISASSSSNPPPVSGGANLSAPSPFPSSIAPSNPTPTPAAAATPSQPTSTPLGSYSATTNAILNRMSITNPLGTPGYEAARKHVLENFKITESVAAPSPTARGRGRGRPRGSRVSGSGTPGRPAGTAAGTSGSPPRNGRGRGRGRGRGAGRGGKRKRVKDEEGSSDGLEDRFDDDDLDDGSDSEAYTSLPTKSRSGRKIQKPTHFDPATKTPTRRKGPYRRMYEAGVCRRCARGAWTPGNKIVFCDGCQAGWHQLCHWPAVGTEIVEEEGKEWFCRDCSGGKDVAADFDIASLKGAENLSLEEKRTYLQTLPPAALVRLLLHATTLHPSLPIYQAPSSSSTLISTSTSSHPLDYNNSNNSTYHHHNNSGSYASHQDQQASSLDPSAAVAAAASASASSVAALYPRAGAGIQLPPETADLDWLQDDDTGVFSHIYREDVGGGGDGVGGGVGVSA